MIFCMRSYSFTHEVWLFVKYLAGYFLLLLPVMILLFDGRALVAQTWWYAMHMGMPDKVVVFSPLTHTAKPEQVVNIKDYEVPSGVFKGDVKAFLIVPKIKISAPIVFPDTVDNSALISYLERGVIKYKDSSEIGKQGTAIIVGHSSAYPWYRGQYGSAFALLSKLEPGDQFAIFTQDKKFVYQVTDRKVIVPGDLKIAQTDSQSHVVLISCWPVRTNKLRMVVNADLVQAL